MRRLRMARHADAYERWERRTDKPLLVLAVLFVGLLVLPYMVVLTPGQRAVVALLDGAFWVIFTVDYAARLYLSPRRWHFVRTHVLDLLMVVVPMLRPLRALRLVRVLRIGALVGVTHVRAGRSLHVRMVAYVLAAACVVIVVAASAVVVVGGGGTISASSTVCTNPFVACASTVTNVAPLIVPATRSITRVSFDRVVSSN